MIKIRIKMSHLLKGGFEVNNDWKYKILLFLDKV